LTFIDTPASFTHTHTHTQSLWAKPDNKFRFYIR